MTAAAARIESWMLPGCGDGCLPWRCDPVAHEQYGRDLGYADAVEDLRPKVVTIGCLRVDLLGKVVTVSGERVHISPSEYDLLAFLAANAGVRYSSKHIEAVIWTVGWLHRPGHIVRVNICRLRKKLGPAASLIDNEPGIGYMLHAWDQAGRRPL